MGFTPLKASSTVRPVRARFQFSCLLIGVGFGVFACSHNKKATEVPTLNEVTPPKQQAPATTPTEELTPLLSLEPTSVGPHLIRSPQGSILAWASPGPGGFRLSTLFVDPEGKASSPRELSLLEESVTQLLAPPLAQEGSVLLAVTSSSETTALHAVFIGAQGELQARPRVVQESPLDIIWAQAVPGPKQSLVFWAERHEHAADLYVARVDGSSVRAARQLKKDATAWQVSRAGGKVALSTVASEQGSSSQLEVLMVDEQGVPDDEAVVIAPNVEGAFDLDMVSIGSDLLLAWSQGDSKETRLMTARLQLGSREVTLLQATPPRGDQTLLRLQAEGSHANVFFEEPLLTRPEQRRVWWARWENSTAQAVASDSYPLRLLGYWDFSTRDALLPSFSTSGPPALIGEGKLCTPDESLKCSPREWDRFYSQLGADSSNYALPLSAALDGKRAELAWDLRCLDASKAESQIAALDCALLVSSGGSPSQIYLVRPESSKKPRALSPFHPRDPRAPFVSAQRALRPVQELSHVSAVRGAAGTVVAWLSYFDPNEPYVRPSRPAPDGRFAPVRALLSTELVPPSPDSSPRGGLPAQVESHSISLRARSFGGVQLAKQDKHLLLAWAALDNKVPQLFLTLLDQKGRRLRQRMVTRHPGEVTDVSVLATDDGFVVLWTDERSGSPQIWAMTVDTSLRTSTPLQVTQGSPAPAQLRALRLRDRIVLVYSAESEEQDSASTSLYVAAIDLDAKRVVAAPKELPCQSDFCHSPQLGLRKDGQLLLAYLERLVGSEQEGSGADLGSDHFAYLQAPAKSTLNLGLLAQQSARTIELSDVGSFSMDCDEQCRVALTSRVAGRQEMWLTEIAGADTRVHGALTLHTASVEAVVPLLIGQDLYYSDTDRRGGDFRLMRAIVDWPAP